MLDSQNLTINAHFRILFPFLICLFHQLHFQIVVGSSHFVVRPSTALFRLTVSAFRVESSTDPCSIWYQSMESSQLGKELQCMNISDHSIDTNSTLSTTQGDESLLILLFSRCPRNILFDNCHRRYLGSEHPFRE